MFKRHLPEVRYGSNLQNSIDQLIDHIMQSKEGKESDAKAIVSLRCNVSETPESYIVEAEIPGFSDEEVQLSIADHQLSIKARHKETVKEDKAHYHVREFTRACFQRVLDLPADVDQDAIQATIQDGLLAITLPKHSKSHSAVKTIPIQKEPARG